jgi:tetratricopeptide (TPR) repeat protein
MQQSPDQDVMDRLEALEAYIDSFDGDPARSLARLAVKENPHAIRRRLTILLDVDRYEEAADLIRGRAPEKEWCEKAITALVQNGECEEARSIIEWSGSLGDPKVKRRCMLCYAESGLIFRDRNKEPVFPGHLADEERSRLEDVVHALTPLFHLVKGNEQVSNALEEHGLRFALHASILLQRRTEAEELAALLATRRPVPLVLVEFILDAGLEAGAELPRRLREEHPNSFDAEILAIQVEGKKQGKVADAFETALQIDVDSLSRSQRLRLFDTLYHLAKELQGTALARLDQVAGRLLGHDPTALRLHLADHYLTANRPEVAGAILEELQDEKDPRWLQLYAHLQLQKGETDEAMGRLVEASKQVPRADLFRQIASVAFGQGRYDIVRDALEKVLALDPRDVRSRTNLAMTLAKVGDLRRAAAEFRKLAETEPGETSHALNEGASLALSNDLEGSLKVYETLCATDEPPLPAVLGRAEVLRALNRPYDAFKRLEDVRERFWDEPHFIQAYLSVAYNARQDKAGSLALLRLRELQAEGKTTSEIVREVPIEEMKRSFLEQRKNEEAIFEEVLKGRVPFLLHEEVRGRVPYLAWAVRTQKLPWISDERRERAEFAIYATNGHIISECEDGRKTLARPECPDQGTAVATDLTSLITLHALGHLDKAADYFGKILVPSMYLERVLRERSKLIPHQLSQKVALERLKAAIDAGKIVLLPDNANTGENAAPVVDEHGRDQDGDLHRFGLVDVVEPMYSLGWLTACEYHRAREVCRKPSGVDESHLGPRLFSPVQIHLSTLITLSQVDCLEQVIDVYRIKVLGDAAKEINQGLRGFQFQEEVRARHNDLWKRLREDPRFVFLSHSVHAKLREQAPDLEDDMSFVLAASLLAEEQSVPLLSDDRVIQVLASNERSNRHDVVFGTDRLLERLGQEGALTSDGIADSILQLMRWRYRFILPSAETLKTLLNRFPDHPPGQLLREVALYVHDCMRDPGLSAGFEPTIPPTSLASALYQGWSSTVAQFVMEVWGDEKWGDEKAREVTRWAMRELLPSVPSLMHRTVQGVLLRHSQQFVLSIAHIKSISINSPDRANTGLITIAETFGMKESEYYATIADDIERA